MARVAVTFLTQVRWPVLQQIRHDGPVRVVADRAVFRNRLVVVHERSALFHVARVTGLVDAVALELFGTRRTMRIVAIGTAHLPFEHRMV